MQHKRRRIEMAPPDGFASQKPVYKPVVPSFSSAFNHPNKLRLQLRPPPKPPVLPISRELKPLQTPPVPPLPSKPAINLRTISKTRVALATDLSTDLASIFLHDQHPDITLPYNHDGRGLALSPEKKAKRKFIRGGLAASASTFFEQSQTSLVLWQKEAERRANTLSSSDLRVNIIKILQEPLLSHKKPGIALCRIRQDTSSHNSDELYRVVFSFPSCLTKSLFNDPHQFSEGRTVRICRPWQEITFKGESSTSALSASLPLPSSEPTLTSDLPVSDKALLCSRFFIL